MPASKQSKTPPAMPAKVARVFDAYPAPVRTKLLALRRLIFDTARKTGGVGTLTETLKWGEPAYLTEQTKSGSTIRLGCPRNQTDHYSLYFNCNTRLVGSFRREFAGHLSFEGNREIRVATKDRLPKKEIAACIAQALTYHQNK